MKYKMCRMQCVLVLVALHVGLAHSWELVIAEGKQLKFYFNGNQTYTDVFYSQTVGAIAYDDVHNALLFVDKQTNNDAIYSHGLFSMKKKYLVGRSGRQIHSLAFDPATEIIFFTDTNERSINWFSLKPGSKNNVHGNLLLKIDDGIPTDIAVDSCKGYIYWMNTNVKQPSIERARFNGTDRKIVINTASLSINTTHKLESHSLTIDQNTKKMFWCEPYIHLVYHIYSADLDGKNKALKSYLAFTEEQILYENPSNTLAVTKNDLISWSWCTSCPVWIEPKHKSNKQLKTLFTLHSESPVSIATNYKIKEQIQGIKDCEALTSLVRNDSVNNNSPKIAAKDDGPFCVHGVKVHGQSVCNCTRGYIGERCDVTVCLNYCLQGNCSTNGEGLPECRCNHGYSGDRCEVYACHGYCLNNGTCSLNEKREPVCQCVGNYEGSRCQIVKYDIVSFNTPPQYSTERNLTLTDLLSNWRKHTKISIVVEV